MLTTAIPDNSL